VVTINGDRNALVQFVSLRPSRCRRALSCRIRLRAHPPTTSLPAKVVSSWTRPLRPLV